MRDANFMHLQMCLWVIIAPVTCTEFTTNSSLPLRTTLGTTYPILKRGCLIYTYSKHCVTVFILLYVAHTHTHTHTNTHANTHARAHRESNSVITSSEGLKNLCRYKGVSLYTRRLVKVKGKNFKTK